MELAGSQELTYVRNMESIRSRPALFLDRDGVINLDKGYVSRIEDFVWVEGAVDCIRHYNDRGWHVFIVTNQSGIAREYYSLEDMQTLHDWMTTEMAKSGARIDRIYYCPFHEEGEDAAFRKKSFDRKPAPGMLLRGMQEFSVDASRSFLIGDKATDLQAAHAAGLPGFLFTGGNLKDYAIWAENSLSVAGPEYSRPENKRERVTI